MGGSSLTLLVLKTPQLTALRRFYEFFSTDLQEERHGNGPLHYAGRIGNLVLELYPLPANVVDADSTTRLGFTVHNLDWTVRSLQAAGVSVMSLPRQTAWGYRAVVRDPDGRIVELYQA